MATRTWLFLDLVEACRKGDAAGWWEAGCSYGPLLERLAARHFPGAQARVVARAVLAEAYRTRLEGFDGHLDLELLEHLREKLFAAARASGAMGHAGISNRAELEAVLADMALLELEAAMNYLRTGDWRAGLAARLGTEVFARHVADKVEARLAGAPPRITDLLLRELEGGRGADCLDRRSVARELEGQGPWGAREAMEKHVAGCRPCLSFLATLEELRALRTELPGATDGTLWSPVPRPPEGRRSFMARFLGGGRG